MTSKKVHIQPVDSAKFLTYQVNRVIKTYESGHVQVQVATTVVPDPEQQVGLKSPLRGVCCSRGVVTRTVCCSRRGFRSADRSFLVSMPPRSYR